MYVTNYNENNQPFYRWIGHAWKQTLGKLAFDTSQNELRTNSSLAIEGFLKMSIRHLINGSVVLCVMFITNNYNIYNDALDILSVKRYFYIKSGETFQ